MNGIHNDTDTRPSILVVDDEEAIRKIIVTSVQREGYSIREAEDAEEALQILAESPVDVVITDINMPGMNGIELTNIIKQQYGSDVIIMTGFIQKFAYDDVVGEGARDFLQKPFGIKEMLLRLNRVLKERSIMSERDHVEAELKATLDTHRRTINGFVQAMSLTIEMRDPYTAGHQRRVGKLARAIARELGFGQEHVDQLYMAGVIHDLGKISVPSEILNKPGQLTEHEFAIIKTHPEVAYNILKNIEFPWPIAAVIYQHHEKLDGSGYPQGLSQDEIHMEAKILAVADVVEAIASHRPYRPALGIEVALNEISAKKGTFYDPDAVEACVKLFSLNKELLN